MKTPQDINVLIACEESQRVCIAFRERGFNAYSCDLQECSGGHPEWHIQGDVLNIIGGGCSLMTQSGAVIEIPTAWDLIIAHPTCTYLVVTGNRWFDTGKYGKAAWNRMQERNKAIAFFYKFVMADCKHIAIENPIGAMSTAYRKPDCIIQPWQFGDNFTKTTCLWLKKLPILESEETHEPEHEWFEWTDKKGKKKRQPLWYYKAFAEDKTQQERAKTRSKTFPGIARAMAEQWGNYLLKEANNG